MRALLYAEVDLNLIDGSAIWAASLAELFAADRDVEVSLLQRTRLRRQVVVSALWDLPNVRFMDPWDLERSRADIREIMRTGRTPRLTAPVAASLIQRLHRHEAFDVIVVRSEHVADLLLADPELRRVVWAYVTNPAQPSHQERTDRLRRIVERSRRVLVQTPEAAQVLGSVALSPLEHSLILPPMIKSEGRVEPRVVDGPLRLGYSGKLSPPYHLEEMLSAFRAVRRALPTAEFHVVGDKFHNQPPSEGFTERLTAALTSQPGVVWHGGVPRDEANRIMGSVHVGASWRSPAFDDDVELSTKVLEYAALGLPVLLNPTRVQRRVFGDGYAGYVQSEDDFVSRVLAWSDDADAYRAASAQALRAAAPYSFSAASRRLTTALRADLAGGSSPEGPTLLFAGHDFKFLQPVLSHFSRASYRVIRDEYAGHVIKDPARSQQLLDQADLVFCEWCLGNAVWYSQHKRPEQALVVRLHHQEMGLDFLDQVVWENVDLLIFISPQHRQAFLARFPHMAGRTALNYNLFDTGAFDRPKEDAARFTLGFMGIAPMRKGPHRAVRLLAALRDGDDRFRLRFKGKQPAEYAWLWRRPEERAYYEAFAEALRGSALEDAVEFDPHGDDVQQWFTQIGFILSTSDHEGSHQAVAEGMASGAVPVIRNWHGADLLYPAKFVYADESEAVARVRAASADGDAFAREADDCKAFARTNFDVGRILLRYEQAFAELLGTSAATGRR